MKKADPMKSEGARLERKAIRRAIRRRIRAAPMEWHGYRHGLESVLAFVQGRQKRYDSRPGGLGRR